MKIRKKGGGGDTRGEKKSLEKWTRLRQEKEGEQGSGHKKTLRKDNVLNEPNGRRETTGSSREVATAAELGTNARGERTPIIRKVWEGEKGKVWKGKKLEVVLLARGLQPNSPKSLPRLGNKQKKVGPAGVLPIRKKKGGGDDWRPVS